METAHDSHDGSSGRLVGLWVTSQRSIAVVMPALNEQRSIGNVLDAIPEWVGQIVVVDNGSTDRTACVAQSRGARTVYEPRRGYGAACLRGLAELDSPDIVVFLDADASDRPEEMDRLIRPILDGDADLVIGSRVLGHADAGSLTWPQRTGNAMAGFLIRRLWNVECTDLGPFRAVQFDVLKQLRMNDLDYGWTVQMQARAARMGFRIAEVPVSYRIRIGESKISGTVRGVIGAGTKILGSIAREALTGWGVGSSHLERDQTLVIFSRLPQAGKTKTRLIPALGEQGAADLQREMTSHTLNIARQWRDASPKSTHAAVQVRFTGGEESAMRELFGSDLTYVNQGDGSLGVRMLRAVTEYTSGRVQGDRCSTAAGRSDGASSVVLIGSDCPAVTPRIIRRAFTALRDADVVIGPAVDGGYYLIGLRHCHGALFDEIDWGTEHVLEQTLRVARDANLKIQCLETLADVDAAADIRIWEEHQAVLRGRATPPALSVIIPSLNEAEHVESAIHSVCVCDDVEVIVADGGSTDGTIEIARGLGASVVESPSGRAMQMNRGAAEASGDVLLFLHADTRLPFGYRSEVDRILARTDVVAGAFCFGLDHVSCDLRLIECGANIRSRWGSMPYGDQALFLPRSEFDAVAGFPQWPVMEDYELVRRLRKRGRIAIAETAVITSARRWLRDGPWRTTWRHQRAIWMYRAGMTPERIAAALKPAGRLDDQPGSESARVIDADAVP